MGQKQSNPNRYLLPLPDIYEKNDMSQVYSLKGYDLNPIQGLSSLSVRITNPQTVTDHKNLQEQKQSQLQQQTNLNQPTQSQQSQQYNPPFLKHFTILLNKFQTREYLNHLVYRNQPEFKQFIVQMPFGEVQKQQKYTKVHLYADELIFTLNQVFNLPFQDMAMVLYTALLAYKYLYSYFGLFKIEANMIGFTREAKAKVWLNNKLTKDKPLPIVSDINLKRYKEQQSYMVDDLLTIFSNKVYKQTIPHNFTLINKASNIRTSRATRLSFSRVSQDVDLSKSTISSLQNNLISDFSDCSFDKCLEYLEGYFNIERPEFFVANKQKSIKSVQNGKNHRQHINFVPSIYELVKTRKQFTEQGSELRDSRVNTNINLRELRGMSQSQRPAMVGFQFRKTHNQQNMAESIVRRPNIMFNSVPVVNNTDPHYIQPVVNQHQIRLTTSSYVPPQMATTFIPPPQASLNKSKSKPKVVFNSPPTTLYERISPSKVYSSSIIQNQNKSNSSLHGSMVSPKTVQNDDFSFRITTSQVHQVYSEATDHKDLRPVLSSQHINFKSGIRQNWQNDDKQDKDSIIDGVIKV